ncbi:MAG: Gfo/Idh/MocA family oxidoreductase [Cytophagales bacterium]|nr:Gfo/Idh/MocA family oxidoreductase [Cytophagales bacterium]
MKRRKFGKHALISVAGIAGVPMIVPSTVFGKAAPSNKIHIGQIGCGRIARAHDLAETLNHDQARMIAVCDVDIKRMRDAKEQVEGFYAKKKNRGYVEAKMYEDYREMLANKDIDAVQISTPDHWHAQPAIEAALSGKDIYLQKPNSLTVEEGRMLSDIVDRERVIVQIGTQLRSSSPQFRIAAELVRNGRIGRLHTVKIGLPVDPSGGDDFPMPVPKTLNYDMWLGSTPEIPYTESGVHPKSGYGRPGWLRREQFSAGMITGLGQHYFDAAAWAMDTELTGPVSIEAVAEFHRSGLWDVHGDFMVKAEYANGVRMFTMGDSALGITYIGTEGWIFVSRGSYNATASDPESKSKNARALAASDPKILDSKIGENEVRLYRSREHHEDWLESIRSRKPPISPVEIGHRACSVCLISHIAMKLGRKLKWDPGREKFVNDAEANRMLSRRQRRPYGTNYVKV